MILNQYFIGIFKDEFLNFRIERKENKIKFFFLNEVNYC